MDVNGENITQLTEGNGIAQRLEWHPDGQTILFTRFIPNVSDRMYLLDVQTREVEPVFPAE
jgi:Tol biopolymer transport system component